MAECVIGNWLSSKRLEKEMSQGALAEQIRKDQTFISKIESGGRRLEVSELFTIADALNLRESEISDLYALWKNSQRSISGDQKEESYGV